MSFAMKRRICDSLHVLMIPPGLSRLVKKVEFLNGSTFFNVFFDRHKVGGQIAATNRRCALTLVIL